jgi:beta-lactam-binding protein with PASTA domain
LSEDWDPDGAPDQRAADGPEDTTLPEDEWPVPEHYRVEPTDDLVHDERGQVVIQETSDARASDVRRFPPDMSGGLAMALVAAILLIVLIPAGLWLSNRNDDAQQSEDTGGPPAATQATTTERGTTEQSTTEATPTSGADQIAVPNVEGMSRGEAAASLRDEGLRVRVSSVASGRRKGLVITQNPSAGTEVQEATIVALKISDGRATSGRATPTPAQPTAATIRVPGVIGLESADATARLHDAGLRVTRRPVESSEPAGSVVSQTPSPGVEVREGRLVTLRVSTGPAQLSVPDVLGLNESVAVAQLESAGFTVTVVDQPTSDPSQDATVVGQTPIAGSKAAESATVTISVGRYG